MFVTKKSLAIAGMMAASVACASAQSVKFNSAGSSAQWQTFALAAKQLATIGAPYTVHHYTIKGNAPDGKAYAAIADGRTSGGKTPPAEAGNLWVVWNETSSGTPFDIWAFTSVDSVVGLRTFFAVPRAKLVLDSGVTSTTAGGQLIAASLWGADDAALPTSVYNVLTQLPLTAANTDIRPEDGLFAYNRAVATLNTTTHAGLGYGPGPIGKGIASHYVAGEVATPIAFSLSGADPITGEAHPSTGFATIPVGASPVVFFVNRTNTAGLGKAGLGHDLSVSEAGNVAETIFSGNNCTFNGVTVNPVLREPLSGTMNTTEFTNFRITTQPNSSQEVNVNPTTDNPLNKTCSNGAGVRTRAVGTGEEINTAVLPTADSIGYSFFGFGNFSKMAGLSTYGYLTLDGVDPINATYTNGHFAVCTSSSGSGICPVAGGASFPNLRNGKYRSWSLLRVVTDGSGTVNYTNTLAITNAAQKLINKTVPDFVPFYASCSTSGPNEPGLDVYRSHFNQSGVTGVNGSIPASKSCAAHTGAPAQTLVGRTFGGGTEAGGDVGGKIEGPFTSSPVEPGVIGAKQ